MTPFSLQFDLDGNGHITSSELYEAMKACGEDIPGFKLRKYIQEVDSNQNGTIEFDEFVAVSLSYSIYRIYNIAMSVAGRNLSK